jgi:hypothetical protein
MDLTAPSNVGGVIIEIPKPATLKSVSPIAREFIATNGPVTFSEARWIYRGLMACGGIWFRCTFETQAKRLNDPRGKPPEGSA